MKNHPVESNNKTHNAPGRGSDKHHPETPIDANERFKKQKEKDNVQDNPGSQNTG